MQKHSEDPGLDGLYLDDSPMLTRCSVCEGWHSHRCDLPTTCVGGGRQAANQVAHHPTQEAGAQ